MTRVELTRQTLKDIAGFTSLPARRLVAKHQLKKDLSIDNERLGFLATTLNDTIEMAGSDRWVMTSTLRGDGFKVVDCVIVMVKKAFDAEIDVKSAEQLIKDAKEEL